MPKIRTKRSAPPPEGWDLIEPTLRELDARMREAEADSHDGKRKTQALWPIFRLHHQVRAPAALQTMRPPVASITAE